MKQLGDIMQIHGNLIEPVDVITFGSPCQDLSVAGGRAGLGGERSGLFMEAIRVIKEMRQATNGIYPTFAVWENVPGAFSSNKGEDFRIVLEELTKISSENASIPRPEGEKWRTTGCIMGNGWSLAWRVFDAQFWGVPQRRRRISLVVDFGGKRASEVLFEREGLQRNHSTGGTPWKRAARTAEKCARAAGFNGWRSITGNIEYADGKSPCINTKMPPDVETYGFSAGQGAKAGGIGFEVETAPTIKAAASGTNMVPCIACKPDIANTLTARSDSSPAPGHLGNIVAIPINDQATHEHGGCNGGMIGKNDDPMYSLTARERHVVCYDAERTPLHLNL